MIKNETVFPYCHRDREGIRTLDLSSDINLNHYSLNATNALPPELLDHKLSQDCNIITVKFLIEYKSI